MKISNFLAFPVLTSGTLVLFVGIFFVYFYQFSKQYRDEKADLMAHAAVHSIQNEIQERVNVINSFGVEEFLHTQSVEKKFIEFSEKLIQLFPDIYLVNLVNSKGIVQKVYPYQKNLFSELMIGSYLQLATTEKRVVLSHRLQIDHGLFGYALYVPIFNKQGLPVGFINVVFGFDEWLRQYLEANDWKKIRIQIQWEKSPEFLFDEGPKSINLNYEKKFHLMDQNFIFKVGFIPSYLDQKHHFYLVTILIFGSMMAVFLFILSYLRVRSELQLQAASAQLKTSHALISALTHDITNPLFSMKLILSKIFENHPDILDKDKNRLNQLFKNVMDMLEVGNVLQSIRLGKNKLKLWRVNLKDSIESACLSLQESIDNKKIKINTDGVLADVFVDVESKSFIHNVLANVLANSIKFSPQGETILIFTEDAEDYFHLIIEDYGLGIDVDEKGYGFDLMQVDYFMTHFNGEFVMENKKLGSGARATLKFPKD